MPRVKGAGSLRATSLLHPGALAEARLLGLLTAAPPDRYGGLQSSVSGKPPAWGGPGSGLWPQPLDGSSALMDTPWAAD